MMASILRMEALVRRWARLLGSIGCMGLLLGAAAMTLDVLMRWIANAPIRGMNDLNQLIFLVGIAACMPLVVAERANISFRMLGEALGTRTSAWLDVVGSAALLLFVVLVGWQLVVYTIELAQSGRTTWQLRIPVTPCWVVATGLVLLCIPVQAAALLLDIVRAAAGQVSSRADGPDISLT
jgi:TRAP-type transport system small permease protein